MKNIVLISFVFLCLVSCKFDGAPEATIPPGFDHISKDGRAHFVYVEPEYRGEKILQREAGRVICRDVFKNADYCEVYYFDNMSDIPTKFPIMNRLRPIGYFELKNDKEKFKVLSEDDNATLE